MNINKKKLGIIGAISIISVILISVFIFTQIGPYDKNNEKGIVVEIPMGQLQVLWQISLKKQPNKKRNNI